MAYEPKTDEGKKALEAGADINVVEQMEKDGNFATQDDNKDKKPEEKKPEEKKPESGDKKPDEGGDEGKDNKGGEIEDDKDKQPDRTPRSIPVWKHKEELKQAEARIKADFEKQIGDLNNKITDLATKKGGATDDDIAKLATDLNLEPEVAEEMVNRVASIVEKRAGLPDIKKTVEEASELQRKAKEEEGFVNEWSSEDTKKSLESVAQGKPITEEVRNKVKELAYTTTYAKYRLSDIIRLNASDLFPADSKESKPAEKGRGGASRGAPVKDLTEMTKEDLDQMTDDEFLKASEALGKKGSRYQFTRKR